MADDGDLELHKWLFPLAAFRELHGDEGGEVNASTPIVKGWFENIGATVMGRSMFGGGPGPWGENPFNGWWGDEPPFHHPVYLLTHHARDPLETQGAPPSISSPTVSNPRSEQAKEAAGGKDVYRWAAAQTSPSSTSPRGSSTR